MSKLETTESATPTNGLWRSYVMAMDDVTDRLERIAQAFSDKSIPFALVGGQAVAMWVATIDPAAVRTTKDVDILIDRADLPKAKAAARTINMDYCEILGVGMFLEKDDPNPRRGVHLIWAAEKVRAEHPQPAPRIDEQVSLEAGKPVVSLQGLVRMKLMADRDHDRVHLRDMIDVGLVGRDMLANLPAELAEGLEPLLSDAGL